MFILDSRVLCFKCRRIDDFHFHTSKLWFRRTEKKTLIQLLVPWHYASWFRNWEFWNPLRFLVDISTQWQVSCLISDILRRPLNLKKYPTFFCNLLMSSTRRCTQYLFIRNGNERLLCFKCRRIDDFHFHTSKLWFRRTEKKTLIQLLVPWHYASWFRNWEFFNSLKIFSRYFNPMKSFLSKFRYFEKATKFERKSCLFLILS